MNYRYTALGYLKAAQIRIEQLKKNFVKW